MNKACKHLNGIDIYHKPTSQVCKECLILGDTWVSLRKCLTCGHVGCCNSSKNKHAQKHFNSLGHPVIEEFPDANWRWCYVDNDYVWFDEEKIMKDLQEMPGVGPSIAQDLFDVDVYAVKQMGFMDVDDLFINLEKLNGKTDRCVLYVFRAAKYYASTQNPDPELLQWKNWKHKKI